MVEHAHTPLGFPTHSDHTRRVGTVSNARIRRDISPAYADDAGAHGTVSCSPSPLTDMLRRAQLAFPLNPLPTPAAADEGSLCFALLPEIGAPTVHVRGDIQSTADEEVFYLPGEHQ